MKIIMLCLACVMGMSLWGQEYTTKNVVFPGDRLDITIYHHPGKEGWADFIARRVPGYVLAVEKFLEAPFSSRDEFDIYGEDKVMLDTRAVGGYNLGEKVALQYDISQIGNPALLYHELGHYWFGSRKGLEWLEEGIVSFLPVVMAERGYLSSADTFTDQIRTHWGLTHISPERVPAFAVETDTRGNADLFGNFYLKTFLVQYLLYLELGPEKYQGFVKDLYHEPLKKIVDFNGLIVLLASWKGDVHWRSFLSGWVTRGDYMVFSPEDFGDPDSDGIISLDEHYLGTDKNRADTDGDGIPDWEELYETGTDPLVGDPVSLVTEQGPFVDGVISEWDRVTYLGFTERKGENGYSANHDLTGIYYTKRNGYLYVNVQTAGTPGAEKEVMFDLLMDFDGDNKADGEVAFMLTNPRYVWYYSYAEKTHTVLDGLKGGMNESYEVRVPLDLIEGAPKAILPIIRDNRKQVNYDEWDSWLPVYPVDAGDKNNDYIIEEFDLFIDGKQDNWERFSPLRETDRVGDTKQRAEFDLKWLEYFFKGEYLYVRIKTGIFKAPLDDIMLDVLIDGNGDNRADFETAFMVGRPQYTWVYDYSLGGTRQQHTAKSDMGDIVEMRIPIGELGIKTVSILPIIRNNTHKVNYDEWDRWITLK